MQSSRFQNLRSQFTTQFFQSASFASTGETPQPPGSSSPIVEEFYEVLDTIGSGAQAVVTRARHRETGQTVAIKEWRSGEPELTRDIIRNFRSMQRLQHPSLVHVQELYVNQNTERISMVMEFIDMPSLEYILKCNEFRQRTYKYKREHHIKALISQLLKAVMYIHQQGICHRDLKPDNILLNWYLLHEVGHAVIKLIDFDVCKQFQLTTKNGLVKSQEMWSLTGCCYYCAPERFLTVGYTEKVDTWSIGVICYQLFTGKLPFHGEQDCDTIQSILLKTPNLRDVPRSPRDLITRLLDKQPESRLSAEEALQHPWFICNRVSRSPKSRSHIFPSAPKFRQQSLPITLHTRTDEPLRQLSHKQIYISPRKPSWPVTSKQRTPLQLKLIE